MPINFPQFNQLNVPAALQAGTQNALGNIAVQQAVQRRDQMNALAPLQQQNAKLTVALNNMKLVAATAPMVNDQTSYDNWKADLESKGVLNPNTLPAAYSPDVMNKLIGGTKKTIDHFSKLQQVPGAPAGTMGQRNLTTNKWTVTAGSGKSGSGQLTALQRNVPFLSKALGVTPKEAAKILTQTKDKTVAGTWSTFYSRALGSNFGDTQAATEAANSATEQIYGPDWQSKLPKNKGQKEPQIEIRVDPQTGQRYKVDINNKKVLGPVNE